MAKLDPMEQVDLLEKGDGVSSRDLRKFHNMRAGTDIIRKLVRMKSGFVIVRSGKSLFGEPERVINSRSEYCTQNSIWCTD